MKEFSVTEYAKLIGITRQAVLKQITTGRLPKGVKAEKIGSFYKITVVKM